MDDVCAVCRTDLGPLSQCTHCGFHFCEEHAEPTVHRCPEYDGDEGSEGAGDGIATRVADGVRSGLGAPVGALRAAGSALSGLRPSPSVGTLRPSVGIPRPSLSLAALNPGLSWPSFQIPRPNLRVPRPSLRIPRPNLRVPRPDLSTPSLDLGLSRPSLRIPSPNLRIPRPSLRIPRPSLRIPRPSLRIPRPSLRIPRPGLSLPSLRPDLSMPSLRPDLSLPNLRVPRPNLRVPRPNVQVPRPNVWIPSPNLRVPRPSLGIPSPNRSVPSPHRRVASAGRRAGAAVRSGVGRLRAAAPNPRNAPEHSPRRIAIAAVLLLTVVVGFTAGGTAAQAVATLDLFDPMAEDPAPEVEPTAPEPAELERAIVAEIVDLRITADRQPYTRDPGLTEIAADHSSDMAEDGYAAVVSPDGENVSDRFERFEYSCDRAAQMVLWVDGANATAHDELAASAVEQWRASEEHATVLESEDYSRVGVGVTRAEDERLYVSLAAC